MQGSIAGNQAFNMAQKGRFILITAVILTGIFALVAIWLFLKLPSLPEGLIQANGRIEGDHYTVSSKWPGRIVEMMAMEGDSVVAGQILLRLDDTQTQTKLEQAVASLARIEAQYRAAQTSLSVFKKNVPLRHASAKAEVAHAEAKLISAQATELQARNDAKRYQELATKNLVAQLTSEQADLAWKISKAEINSAHAGLKKARQQLAEAKLGYDQIVVREHEVAEIAAQISQAEAAVSEAKSILNDLTITAPASGVVTTRIADLGEIASAGSPLYDIVDLDRLYLKVYVPEIEIAKVRLGLQARIYSDAFPNKPFPASVKYIASQAEFTPKEVQTRDERVKLVFAVKLYLEENPKHKLTPGLPADAVIRWQETTPWAKPQW